MTVLYGCLETPTSPLKCRFYCPGSREGGAEVKLPRAILKDDSHDQRPLASSTT